MMKWTVKIFSLSLWIMILTWQSSASDAARGHIVGQNSGSETMISPQVSIAGVNTSTVRLYEKFEVLLSLTNASYTNPYDPIQIDVRATFTAPSGKTWEIMGFYDNFLNRNQWKLRFAPNEAGDWRYQVRATDSNGTGATEPATFTAVASSHHGWLKVAPMNPHYLMHDDGTSFYGVGPYYPWGVNNGPDGLGVLQAAGANFWGYWNIMYGNEGNIIESLQSGLGRYDQPKCGRIDQLIDGSEARGLTMMFAIWPHDLLSNTVWAHQWHQNPYNTVTSVFDFYRNELAWEYQKKQYRYIIARWGYSRSMGVWEIVNEINGTDGWAVGREAEATQWVRRVHDYLKANDPFGRPTTASMSGGWFWSAGYQIVDLPNVHLYETDWPALYGGNPLRSSLWTYQKVTRQLWDNFAKPAIMGEAGYTNTYGNFPVGSAEYTAMYHNALWVSWANGLAVTPVWWAFTDRQMMNAQVMEQMRNFAKLVKDIDYSQHIFTHAEVNAPNCDAFAMNSEKLAFGWLREHNGKDVSLKPLTLAGLVDTSYTVQWYNTWTGQFVATHIRPAVQGVLTDFLPQLTSKSPDLAFIIRPAEIGDVPTRVELFATPLTLLNDGQSTTTLTCYLFDAQNRFCQRAANAIDFSLSGPGQVIGPSSIQAQNGTAMIQVRSQKSPGQVQIWARSNGLSSDSVTIQVTDQLRLDDFEDYGTNASLRSAWLVRAGTNAVLSLDGAFVGAGQRALRVNYIIGNGNPPYAGFVKALEGDYSGVSYLRFWLRPDDSSRDLAILLFEKSGRYWQKNVNLVGTGFGPVNLKLTDFVANDGATALNLANLKEIAFNILKSNGDFGSGTLYIDEIAFQTEISTAVNDKFTETLPLQYELWQNFPNPFNQSTRIQFQLPARAQVTVAIFDARGSLVETLLDSVQEPGLHAIYWHANAVASGVYFYQIRANSFTSARKCVLIK